MGVSGSELNRVATEWLAARFIGVAAGTGADSFGMAVEEHFADDAAMLQLARIVRGAASPEQFDVLPESAGLRVMISGCVASGIAPATVFDVLLAGLRVTVSSGERLETNVFLDETTGLPNRFLFLDRLTHAIAFAHRHDTLLALCSIRFDFAEVTGHVPRVAREIADRLRNTFREIDTIGRLGVDEFCIIITDLPKRDLADVAIAKLTEILQEPYDIGERAYGIAARIGISLYPPHGHDARALLDAAREGTTAARNIGVFGER